MSLWWNKRDWLIDWLIDNTYSVDDMVTTPPECTPPGLTSANISPKKMKLYNDFSSFITNDMDGEIKRLANPSIVRDKFFLYLEKWWAKN